MFTIILRMFVDLTKAYNSIKISIGKHKKYFITMLISFDNLCQKLSFKNRVIDLQTFEILKKIVNLLENVQFK